jgi:hypothetical protein
MRRQARPRPMTDGRGGDDLELDLESAFDLDGEKASR